MQLDPVIEEIRGWHRRRCFALSQRQRIDNALGAYVRIILGWSLALPEKEREAISKAAAELIEDGDTNLAAELEAAKLSRAPWDALEKVAVKNMERLAEQLPVWQSFGEGVRGFGLASLAVIVAEAGDLSNYADKSKLWKRMGLAVMDGIRQGGLPKGSDAEEWIEHGYNPKRRSKMWNIGDTLIKGNRDGKYRTAYLARKEYELKREPDMKPIKAHRRAQRYMEKMLLRDLWRAWRADSEMSERTETRLPPTLSVAA